MLIGLISAAASSQAATSQSTSKAPAASTPKAKTAAARADVRSTAFLVIDELTEDVLLAQKADTPMPIASITKLMTALVVLDADQPLDELVKITQDDRNIEPGRLSNLVVGATLPRGDLIHLALMSSENRAANALARNYPGGLAAALSAMNAKAQAIGMEHAHFDDPTGLSNHNVASPRDLTKLVEAAADHPVIREYSTDPSHTFIISKRSVEYRNTNNLVQKPDWDVVVQKTGFTNAAGQCLVMKTMIEERPVVMILMNSFGKYTRVADARRVRKWLEDSDKLVYGSTQAATGRL